MGHRHVVALAAALTLLLAGSAHAGVSPFEKLTCTAMNGVRECVGTVDQRVPSFDKTPLDVNVALPASGDGPLPLITMMHGYGGKKYAPNSEGGPESPQIGSPDSYARRGYAVLTFSARGFGDSCGSATSRASAARLGADVFAACQQGYIHLDDMRFEARDAQYLMGLLVDQGIADPQRLGVTGVSYGGITSTQLAALKDRMFNASSKLVPFTSPKGTAMRIAAAAPSIPGSDLAYSLIPNGRTTDYTLIDRKTDIQPFGVEKQSYVTGFFGTGNTTGGGYYSPPNGDPNVDLTSDFARLNAGEPYTDAATANIIDQISKYHGGFALLSGDADFQPREAPAPTLFGNGFTDDLFPVDEALRFGNKAQALFPGTPISYFFLDYGHARGAGKSVDLARLRAAYAAWMDHYVKGDGTAPAQGVTTLTQTCPKTAASEGPFTASSWDKLHPGEIRRSVTTPFMITSQGGDPSVATTFDPIASSRMSDGQSPCYTASATDQPAPATATLRLPAAKGSGFTLMGAPTVIAKITKTDADNAQIAARLLDVTPDGKTETLVARTLYRPVGTGGVEAFQLHANGYRFAAGHTPKLELLGADAPYGRASNATFSVAFGGLQLRLPVLDAPDCDQVLSHAPPVVPDGQALAPGVAAAGTGPCGDAAAQSKGNPGDNGSLNGKPLDASGVVAGSGTTGSGSSGPKPATANAAAKPRIVFGHFRFRLGYVRRHGMGVRITCTSKCTATASSKAGRTRVARATRSGKRFTARVRLTKSGSRRLGRHKRTALRTTVRVRDAAGRTTTRTARVSVRR